MSPSPALPTPSRPPAALRGISWVTNNGKTIADADKTYTDSYPTSEGFKDCTVTLADDISLAKPAQGVASGFEANWIPIGTYKGFDDVTTFKAPSMVAAIRLPE